MRGRTNVCPECAGGMVLEKGYTEDFSRDMRGIHVHHSECLYWKCKECGYETDCLDPQDLEFEE